MAQPIRTSRVRVTDVIDGWDMRGVHILREHRKMRNLSTGSCVVAFNKEQNIARIIDWQGGVHTYYADDNEFFDMESLRELSKTSYYVDLVPGEVAARKAQDLWQIAS